MVVGALVLAGIVAAIIWGMATRLWGEPLLSTIGSRHTPLWLSWFITSFLLVVSAALLGVCIRNLVRVIRGRRKGVGARGGR